MENNQEQKKLKIGERVYIDSNNNRGNLYYKYVQAIVRYIGQQSGNSFAYRLTDVNGKTHDIYYPESKSNERILTLYECVNQLSIFEQYAKKEIVKLEKEVGRAEYLIEELKNGCGKNGTEHVFGEWQEIDGFDGNIVARRSGNGISYNLVTEKRWHRTCKCCGHSEVTKIMPEEIIEEKGFRK